MPRNIQYQLATKKLLILIVIWVGMPILIAAMYVSRGFATQERARVGPVFGRPMHHPYYKTRPGAGPIGRMLTPLADGTWHVGDGWSPDRLRFDTVVTGVAQHAVYNAVRYSRSFLD